MKKLVWKVYGAIGAAACLAGLIVISSCNMKMKFYTAEDKLVAFNWTLHKYEGKSIDLQGYPNGVPVIRFNTDSTLVLYTGCQFTKGIYAMTEELFDIEIDTEQINCQLPSAGNLIQLLNHSNQYVLSKEKLLILLDGKEVLSFFEK